MKQRWEEVQGVTSQVVASIASIRKERSLSLRKLASMAGVTQPGLALVERGERKPTLHYLIQLCRALEIDLWPLLKKAEQKAGKGTK